ncbi:MULTISPECIES: hypothetical protein [Sphingomonas]|uniref:Glyoxalase-like domain-containing protein n=1 Tax=Sphingomonas kyeonggiensis TaxID=1268553 RepID=A0A7W7K400_9SPHN|nr:MULTISPECIES: hypothetical protein [Sphingomonas]MBB4840297.1 hypothetical protein [Sphingomonas kyeonggiensis]WHU04914.1 hypothetical protein O3305_10110 [Sphingomonas sp. NIBR02145]
MLFHISISSDAPAATAFALAEIMGGVAMPFPPIGNDSWIAFAGDENGTAIEVYARGWQLEPSFSGNGVRERFAIHSNRFSPFHAAVATPLDEAAVHAVARRESWHVETVSRGGVFDVIEVWVDNALMLEILTAEMQDAYRASMTVKGWASMLAAARMAHLAA